MKKFLLFFASLFLLSMMYATPPDILWSKTYGSVNDDEGRCVQQTADGGYIFVGIGRFSGMGYEDVYLVKTNADGDTLWTGLYGSTASDGGYSVQQTSDYGYVLTGYTQEFGLQDLYLIKTDAQGNEQWTKIYGGTGSDYGQEVQQTTDGGYIVVGGTESFASGYCDIWLLKTDANGDTMWAKSIGQSDVDYGNSVQQTADGGYIIAGGTQHPGTYNNDMYLVKTNANGDTMWTKSFGGADYEEAYSVRQTTDHGYIIAGYTDSYGVGDGDYYLVKTDSLGNTLWTKTYGGVQYEFANFVRQIPDGGYVLVGTTTSYGAGYEDFYCVRTDANGDTIWTATYGNALFDYGYSGTWTSDGGYVFCGTWCEDVGGGMWRYDLYLVKTVPEDSMNPTVPQLISPVNNTFTSDAMITFLWHAATDAGWGVKEYELHCALDSVFTSPILVNTQDTIYNISLNDTTYFWQVRAIDYANHFGDWSSIWRFVIDTQAPQAPMLLSPVSGIFISDTLIDFQWSQVTFKRNSPVHSKKGKIKTTEDRSSPIYYIFELDTLNDFVSAVVTDTFDMNYAILPLTENLYYWHVKAYDLAGNQGPYSNPDSFSVDITPPVIESTTIWHDTSYAGPFPMYSRIMDNGVVDTAILYYKRVEDPDWFFSGMLMGANNWYHAVIPQVYLDDDTIKYYIYTRDIAQPPNEAFDPPNAPSEYHWFIANATGIAEQKGIPHLFSFKVQTNPSKGKVLFNLALPADALVVLYIYDISGRLIAKPLAERKSAGVYHIPWTTNVAGVYFYSLESPWQKKIGKLIILK